MFLLLLEVHSIGLGVRFVMLEKGADQFTANGIFWIVILMGWYFTRLWFY